MSDAFLVRPRFMHQVLPAPVGDDRDAYEAPKMLLGLVEVQSYGRWDDGTHVEGYGNDEAVLYRIKLLPDGFKTDPAERLRQALEKQLGRTRPATGTRLRCVANDQAANLLARRRTGERLQERRRAGRVDAHQPQLPVHLRPAVPPGRRKYTLPVTAADRDTARTIIRTCP